MDKYENREQAGQILAGLLQPYAHKLDVWVLALPRGGVPVALVIAQSLALPLDIFMVRKLGLPQQEELAMGAIASGGEIVLNQDIVHNGFVAEPMIQAVIEKEKKELERREALYRQYKPYPHLEGKTIILVDDGVATGATMRVAIAALRGHKPQKIIVATPVMAEDTYHQLIDIVDEIVCPLIPTHFVAVASWYVTFPQTTDQAVCDALALYL